MVLPTASYLQLTYSNSLNLSVAPGYIIVWHPPASCGRHICTQFNPSTVNFIPWYLRPDAPVPWSMAGSEVNMLQIYFERPLDSFLFFWDTDYLSNPFWSVSASGSVTKSVIIYLSGTTLDHQYYPFNQWGLEYADFIPSRRGVKEWVFL